MWNGIMYITHEHNNKRVININFCEEIERRKTRQKKEIYVHICDIYTQLKAEFNFHFYIKTQRRRQRSTKREMKEEKNV